MGTAPGPIIQASSIGPLALSAAQSSPTFPSPDWIAQSPANVPPARNGAVTAPDPTGKLVLFGGQATPPSPNFFNDTWTWDGANWTQRFPANSPPARYEPVMIYDQARQVVVLFGGLSFGGARLNDTWTWDGTNWTERSPLTRPAARYAATAAYDAAGAQTVLYGGRASFMPPSGVPDTFLNDTWTWDGTNWAQATPAASPGFRYGASAAFNPPTGKLVLFGGLVFPCGTSACQGSVSGETWTWDGANWTNANPGAAPSPRHGQEMAYDPDLAGVVLFGGDTNSLAFNQESWLWDGAGWSPATGIAAPAARSAHAMGFHAGSRRMIVFGGFTGTAFLNNDTWGYSTAIPIYSITTDRGPDGIYSRGEAVTYTVQVSNAGLGPMSDLNMVSDLAEGLLAGSGAAVRITDGLTPANEILCGVAPVLCQLLNGSLAVGTLTIPAGDVFQIAYNVVAVGLDRACSSVINKVIGSVPLGSGLPLLSKITVCDVALGLEDWWSYVSRDLGPQSTASVNVANGNLVVQAVDTTPVQAHGRLDYTLGRTYNSADTTLVTLPNTFGAGWTLNIAQTGDLAGLGFSSGGIYVPSVEALLGTALNPLGVTFVDRDGTRHVFQTKALSATLPVLGVVAGEAPPLVSGALATLVPNALSLDVASFTNLCIDQTFTSPAGVHIGLSRYIAVRALAGASNPCEPTARDPQTDPVIVGFVAERPDRLRYEFSASGQLLDMVDPNGVDLRYTYDAQDRISTIHEPRSCADPATPTCRAFRFTYPSDTETHVVDPAGRLTKYIFDSALLTKHLLEVQSPDGTSVFYTYQGVAGASCPNASPGQLCSVTDPRDGRTEFSYVGALLGPARLGTIRDRRGSDTIFTYPGVIGAPDVTTADQAGHRQQFGSIDATGRVGSMAEGSTTDPPLREALYTWDTPAAPCRQPDPVVDNNLCRLVRDAKAQPGYATNEDTSFVYNAEGQVLSTRQVTAPADVVTTYGYRAQYVQVGGTVATFEDTVAGNGVVTSTGPAGGRAGAATLFAISDRTQLLPPRGNAAGGGFAPFLTTYKLDNNTSVTPNAVPAGPTCADPGSPSANTGNLCEVVEPAFDGSSPTVTRFTYDVFGQRATMTTPKAIAETPAGTTPPSFSYSYFTDADLATDDAGATSAGGWLKAITDPTGAFVAFGYDRAGNVTRTYDRNATEGQGLGEFAPGGGPAGLASAQFDYFFDVNGGLIRSNGATSPGPWRYLVAATDPVGNRTSYTLDNNGNAEAIRPPRGNAAGDASFDITQEFDDGDNLTSRSTPAERAANKTTEYRYDPFGNMTSVTDPNGAVRTFAYDPVNRRTEEAFSRGPWPADTSTVPPACRQSGAGDAPMPAGRIRCATYHFYDGVDNRWAVADANGQGFYFAADGVHRTYMTASPRNDGSLSFVYSMTVFDTAGNPIDVCTPRLYTEGGIAAGTCPASPAYGVHNVYDVAGRLQSETTQRYAGYPASTTSYSYDADGNIAAITDANEHTTTYSHDLLDRRIAASIPRDAATTNTTQWNHDRAGNVTALISPGDGTPAGRQVTAYSYDAANRLLDTVVGADDVDAVAAGLVDAAGTKNVRSRALYDADSNVVARFDPRAFATSTTAPDARFMTRTDYDANGRPVATYVPRYDGTSPANPASNLSFSSPDGGTDVQASQCQPVAGGAGVVPAYPGAVGVCVTTTSYDPAGQATRVTLPTKGSNRYLGYTYTDDGLLASIDAPSPAAEGSRVSAASYLYDGVGRPVKSTDALGHQQTTAYFSDGLTAKTTGQPATQSDFTVATHVSTFAYDAAANLTKTTDPVGNATVNTYWNDDLPLANIDPAGNATVYIYDRVGNPTAVYSPSAWAHDATNPSGTPTVNTFTFDNLLEASVAPVSGDGTITRRSTYGYDPGGRKTTHTVATLTGGSAAAGRTQTFSYGANGRLLGETATNPGAQSSAAGRFGYDAAGNRTTVEAGTVNSASFTAASTLRGTYYLDGAPRSVNDGTHTTGYAYDGAGQLTGRAHVVNGGATTATAIGRGDAGLPTAMVSDVVGGGRTTWSYDAAGRPSTEDSPNGQRVTRTYYDDDTLNRLVLTQSGGAHIAIWGYQYDNNGRIKARSSTGMAAGGGAGVPRGTTYAYDPAGRLSTVADSSGTRSLGWDHNSNRTSYGGAAFTYNADNSLATGVDPTNANQVPRPHAYDSSGRLTDDGCTAYNYDGLDRMTSATPFGAQRAVYGCPGLVSLPSAYEHDGLDRQRSVGVATNAVHYDGWSSEVAVQSALGVPDVNYELDADANPRAVKYAGMAASTARYLTDDGQGNVSTVTNASAVPICTARFDPFGTPLDRGADPVCATGSSQATASSPAIDIFYRGARRDRVTGDYQFGSRTYDPTKGAFLTPDFYRTSHSDADLSVVVDPLTQNRYSYVNGDPLNRTDPDGHGVCFMGRGIGCEGKDDRNEACVFGVGLGCDKGEDEASKVAEAVGEALGEAAIEVKDAVVESPVVEAATDVGEFALRNRDVILAAGATVACGAAAAGTAGFAAAACGPLVAASLANAAGTSAVNNGLLPGGARADFGGFTRDLTIEGGTSLAVAGAGKLAGTALRRAAPVVRRAWSRADDVVPSAPNTADVGLSTRGLRPAPGTRVRPEGVPEGWRIEGTRSAGGTRYYDPTNPGNSVRVMQGNPNSPYPTSQSPYVRWQRDGHALDAFGNKLPTPKHPDAHIPLQDFRFLPELFG
ncbi:MAG: RHS repeat-associated core domain-containing protein [Acidimicrobiales bacterium]